MRIKTSYYLKWLGGSLLMIGIVGLITFAILPLMIHAWVIIRAFWGF